MTELSRSTPAEQGVDASGIDAFIAAVADLPEAELHSLMVLRHGHVVAERWWSPYTPGRPKLLYSVTKSFTSTAIGFAVAEGLVDLDATVLSYFPEFDERVTDPRSRAMKVRHVAAMASGHADERIDEAYRAGDGDILLGLLLVPPEHDPGTFFAYNQPCTHALSAILNRVSGGSLTDYLRPRLFEPLGIEPGRWLTDRQGREQGYSGLHLTTDAIAKLGQLYLDGGRWQGRRLLPSTWVEEATRAHILTQHDSIDSSQGYGFQFWRSRHGYRADGAFGQFSVVLPEADAVVAITGQSQDAQSVLDALWTHLLPALTAGPGPTGPFPASSPQVTPPQGTEGGIPPATFERGPAVAPQRPFLQRVRTTPGELALDDDGTWTTAELGAAGTWTVTGPLATAWAFSGESLLVDVILLDSPHRLHLVLDPASGTFTERWAVEPIVPIPLRKLSH